MECWNNECWKDKDKSPGGEAVVATRGISQPHAHSPRGTLIAMVYRHRAHNRGVGPFLLSFRKTNSQAERRPSSAATPEPNPSTGVAALGILSAPGRFGAKMEPILVLVAQRRPSSGKQFDGKTSGDQS